MTYTRARAVQWFLILLVLIGGVFAYYQFRTKAAQTIVTNASAARPDFEAPLKTDLNLTAGTGTATYSRADGADRRATVTDFEGLIRPVKQNEARFDGARRVENFINGKSEDYSNAAWGKFGTASITGTTVLNIPAVNDYIQNYPPTLPLAKQGDTTVLSVTMSGSGTVQLSVGSFGGTFEQTNTAITLSSIPTRFSISKTWANASHTGVFVSITHTASTTATQVTLGGIQLEDVTGQANQNPSEYVSVGVKTVFPYHGAGVDGVKYFDYQNGNTVASNVVTEAKGAAIPESTLKGFLAEGSRTNLATYSQDCSNAVWALNNTTWASKTSGAATAPDGSVTGCKLVDADTSSNIRVITAIGATVSAGVITGSVYVKAGEYNSLVLYLVTAEGAHAVRVVVSNLDTTASIGASAVWWGTDLSSPSATIASAGNGWWKVTLTATSAAGSTSAGIGIYNKGGSAYVGVPGSGVYFWGAQLEQAAVASSYIPTTSASVTRAADSLWYPETGNFNDATGTVSLETTPNWTGGFGRDAHWVTDYASNERLSIWHWSGTNNGLTTDRNSVSSVRNNTDYSGIAITAGTQMRLAERWSDTAVSFFGNGSLWTSDTTLTLPYSALSSRLYIGRDVGVGYEAYSDIKNVRVWKQAMSDTFLNGLTTGQSGTVKQLAIKIPDNTGLVGYWSFEDGSGTKATDFSGNGNTGTLTNGPTWTTGRFGKAVNFDGTNDYVDAGTATSTAMTDNFTLSTWINPASLHTVGYYSLKNVFISRDDGSESTINYLLQIESDTSITFKKRGSAEGIVSYTFTGTPSLTGRWSHVILVVSSGTATLYVNGAKVSALPITAISYQSGQRLFVGGGCVYCSQSESMLTGQIDDVRIYNRALSADEVKNLYQKSASAKINVSQNDKSTNGLVGLWSFNGPDLSGTTAYDRSGQGNNGTLTNGPAVTEGKIGQALSFDGTDDYVNMGTSSAYDITGPITVSAWVKVNSFKADGSSLSDPIVGKWSYAAGNHKGYDLRFFTTNHTQAPMFVVANGTDYDYVTASQNISVGTWTHIVGTWSPGGSNNFQIYVNGVVTQKTNNYVSLGVSANPLHIGHNFVNAAYFNGSIDDVRIYNRALSASEIQDLYNQGK